MTFSVIQASDVRSERTTTGAYVRTLLPSDGTCLGRRLVDVPAGSQFSGNSGAVGELLFVIGGSGDLDGVPVSPDHGIWIPPGRRYLMHSSGDLSLDVVSLPGATTGAGSGAPLVREGSGAPLVRDLRDCAVESTGDRQFRVLFGPGTGCAVATQFVGHIPPGRAPDHRHPYDEVVLVLSGHGVVHVDGSEHAISAGTCTHLRPGQPHCLENTGQTAIRVLGVFHPADSPATKT